MLHATPVIKMMNIGGRLAGPPQLLFPEHNSATVRNILMVLGRILLNRSMWIAGARMTTLLMLVF